MKHLLLLLFFLIPLGCAPKGCQQLSEPVYLRVHIESDPQTLDPFMATGHREFLILQTLYEGLTRYHPETLKPLPGVAKNWALSEDGLVYTFHLRSDAKWSDGKQVTAQDFWNGWEHLLNPKTAAPYAFQLFYVKGAQDYAKGILKDPQKIGMKVKGTWVFEVTLEKPTPHFLTLTSFAALSPKRNNGNLKELTNGPFVLDSKDPQKGILLLPNKYYWGRNEVKLSGVQFRPFGDFKTALKFYGRTGIDIMADLPPTEVPLLKFRSDFHSAPLFRTEYFIFNSTRPPFDRKEMRQALAFALDRTKIADEILQRGDIPFGFLIPSGLLGFHNAKRGQVYDPVRAQELLKEAGLSDISPLPVIQIHHNNAPDRKLVAQAAQKMWLKILGVQSELVEEEWPDYLATRRNRDYQISWGGWYGDYLDPKTFLELFLSDNRQNNAGWGNKKYDEWIAKTTVERDYEKRMAYFQEAEQILLDEAVIIPVLVKTKTHLIQPYVKGYYPNLLDIHPLRDVYSLRP